MHLTVRSAMLEAGKLHDAPLSPRSPPQLPPEASWGPGAIRE